MFGDGFSARWSRIERRVLVALEKVPSEMGIPRMAYSLHGDGQTYLDNDDDGSWIRPGRRRLSAAIISPLSIGRVHAVASCTVTAHQRLRMSCPSASR